MSLVDRRVGHRELGLARVSAGQAEAVQHRLRRPDAAVAVERHRQPREPAERPGATRRRSPCSYAAITDVAQARREVRLGAQEPVRRRARARSTPAADRRRARRPGRRPRRRSRRGTRGRRGCCSRRRRGRSGRRRARSTRPRCGSRRLMGREHGRHRGGREHVDQVLDDLVGRREMAVPEIERVDLRGVDAGRPRRPAGTRSSPPADRVSTPIDRNGTLPRSSSAAISRIRRRSPAVSTKPSPLPPPPTYTPTPAATMRCRCARNAGSSSRAVGVEGRDADGEDAGAGAARRCGAHDARKVTGLWTPNVRRRTSSSPPTAT